MPNSKEQLLAAIGQNDFKTAINIIQDNPKDDLVNATDKDGENVLMLAVDSENPDFIKFILSHNKFNSIDHVSPTQRSAMKALIGYENFEIAQMALQNPKAVSVNGELTYKVGLSYLKSVRTSYAESLRDDPESKLPLTKTEKRSVEYYTQLLSIIRDKTIRHAIATDDVTLFNELKKLGTDPSGVLLDGTYPASLVSKDRTPKLSQWMAEDAKQALAAMSKNQHAMFQQQQASRARYAEYMRTHAQLQAAQAASAAATATTLKRSTDAVREMSKDLSGGNIEYKR